MDSRPAFAGRLIFFGGREPVPNISEGKSLNYRGGEFSHSPRSRR